MLFQSMLFQSCDDGLGIGDGVQVLDEDLAVWSNENDRGIIIDAVLVTNGHATRRATYGRILHTIGLAPVLANLVGVGVAASNFHIVHVMHVAPHGIIGFHHFWRGLLAWPTGGIEEVDEHVLATIEDVK